MRKQKTNAPTHTHTFPHKSTNYLLALLVWHQFRQLLCFTLLYRTDIREHSKICYIVWCGVISKYYLTHFEGSVALHGSHTFWNWNEKKRNKWKTGKLKIEGEMMKNKTEKRTKKFSVCMWWSQLIIYTARKEAFAHTHTQEAFRGERKHENAHFSNIHTCWESANYTLRKCTAASHEAKLYISFGHQRIVFIQTEYTYTEHSHSTATTMQKYKIPN